MPTVHPFLDKRKKRQDGTYPLKLVITQRSVSAMMPLDINLEPEHWDSRRRQVMVRPDRNRLNGFIKRQVIQIEDVIHQLQLDGRLRGRNIKQIRDMIRAELEPAIPGEQRGSFMRAFDAHVARHTNAGTLDIYKHTRMHLLEFCPEIESYSLEDITVHWLEDFDEHLKARAPSANTRAINMRNIRAAFNYAIDNEMTTAYPFRRFKIQTQETAKRSLKVEKLRELLQYTPQDPAHQRDQDCFRLIFYLIGINTVDLCNLKENSLVDGRIEYRRAKTGRFYSIKVEPEAMELIERNRSKKKKGYLLNCMDNMSDYRNYATRMNDYLHTLQPRLSTYYARHSWATIAHSLNIQKDVIAAALGHGPKTVTDVYIDFDQEKVDRANRIVLDWVLYGKRPVFSQLVDPLGPQLIE